MTVDLRQPSHNMKTKISTIKVHHFETFLIILLGALLSASPSNLNAQATKKYQRNDQYLSNINTLTDLDSCYCSTLNDFQIPVYLRKTKYPYQGDYKRLSKEQAMKDRFVADPFSQIKAKFPVKENGSSYYEDYTDISKISNNKKFIDVNLTKIFNHEQTLVFDDETLKSAESDLNKMFIPEQELEIIQYGKVAAMGSLGSHWYQIKKIKTKIASRDLGTYYQITHFFPWSGATYSVTFNINHYPTQSDLIDVKIFLTNFGMPCKFKQTSANELLELRQFIQEYYRLSIDNTDKRFTQEDFDIAIDCAIEKLLQEYTCSEILQNTMDFDYFDQTVIGCIIFLKKAVK
jgi:hypothetical protein